jgi:hypothetical protein
MAGKGESMYDRWLRDLRIPFSGLVMGWDWKCLHRGRELEHLHGVNGIRLSRWLPLQDDSSSGHGISTMISQL